MRGGGKDHWERVYQDKPADSVSWYTPHLRVSLDLIDEMRLPPGPAVIDVGGGTSALVDDLLARGWSDMTVLDLSRAALDVSRRRLGARADRVTWVEADITETTLPAAHFDLWHDRAVFHFLTTADARRRYVDLARRALRPGGHIIVATFGPDGPTSCSGLDVERYDPDRLHGEFGASFEKVKSIEETHRTPRGSTQSFVYCYCRRADQP
jgi:ubiquinone/menaquinone biosynthesis C-methylase UbiE